MRADGASIDAVRRHLLRHGIERTPKAVAKLLHSRTYLGELHFGDLQNPAAHDAIIDRPTWERAQRASAPRGRQPQSERLLARLGVLRCGTCGSRMSVTTSNYRYPAYRCGQPDCERRQTVSAPLVEGMVVEEVKRALADVEGRASAEQNIREAAAALDRAQAEYEKLIELLDPMEPAAAKRLGRAKDKRDKAQEHLDRLGGTSASLTVTAAGDWERLTLDERRALIRAVVGRAVVAPGRGTDRITIHLVGE